MHNVLITANAVPFFFSDNIWKRKGSHDLVENRWQGELVFPEEKKVFKEDKLLINYFNTL